LVLAYWEQPDQREAALEHARRASDLAPDDPRGLVFLGGILGVRGDYVEALKHFESLTERHPKYAAGWLLKAMAVESLGRTQEAETLYGKALEIDPKSADALEYLGILAFIAGRYEEALAQFEALNKVRPDYSMGWTLTGRAAAMLGRAQEAESLSRKAMDLDPGNTTALEQLGILVATTGRYEEALAHFEALNKVRPDYSRGWTRTAWALNTLRRVEEAEAACRRALELDPTEAQAWAQLSCVMERLGRGEEAATAFQRAIENGADKANLLNSRGEARRQRGEYALAIQDYEESLRADPNAVWPHFNVVSALLGLGRVEEAVNRLPAAIDADQRSKDPCGGLVTQSFHENCVALFEHSPPDSFPRFLTAVLDLAREQGAACRERFEESLPLTTFALLRDHERIGEERFNGIIQALADVVGKRIETSVAVRFLRVGVDYFKKKDRKALLRLAREERRVFCRELGIEAVEA
jgi:tetratricopeptide (TPR) repeat protein